MSFMNMDQAYVANTYKRFPVEIVSGKGSRVVDVNGKSYVDMGSGIGVTAFGISEKSSYTRILFNVYSADRKARTIVVAAKSIV